MKRKNVIVIGSGKVAAGCIGILASKAAAVSVIETEQQALSCVRMVSNNLKLSYRSMTDFQQLTGYLKAIRKNTLVVSANNNYLFPTEILAKKNLCIVNFHNALLPAYPGRNAPTWVIFDGEDKTGVTWHFVGNGVDTGDILAQRSIPIGPDVTALELVRSCMDEGIQSFDAICDGLLKGEIEPQQQDLSLRRNYHRSWEVPNQGFLDMSWPLTKAHSFLRSLDYGRIPVLPLPRVFWAGKTYVVKKYQLLNSLPGKHGMVFRQGQMVIQDGEKTLIMELERRMEYEPCRNHFAGIETRTQFAAN